MGYFSNNEEVNDDLPTQEQLNAAFDLKVVDENGKEVPFRQVLQSRLGSASQILVVFIRHNFCGNCVRYVQALSKNFDISKNNDLSVVIIGHGTYEGIKDYKQVSMISGAIDKFEMYQDAQESHTAITKAQGSEYEKPSIYKTLGMTKRTMAQPKNKPSYFKDNESMLSVALSSVGRGLQFKSPPTKSGDIAKQGGEFIFDRNLNCTFCHRMKDSGDHTDVAKLADIIKKSSINGGAKNDDAVAANPATDPSNNDSIGTVAA